MPTSSARSPRTRKGPPTYPSGISRRGAREPRPGAGPARLGDARARPSPYRSRSMFPRRFQHDVVDSTSECAFRALADGSAQHGDVHVARAQTAGRGRRGRSWQSASGEGLYLSVILVPEPPPYPAPALTIAAGLAVRDAVANAGLARARLDWPNDVVVDRVGAGAAAPRDGASEPAKLAGILVETRGLDREAPHYVIGIGVNVHQRVFAAELTAERAVTSLALEGIESELELLADGLLARLATRVAAIRTDPASLAADYLTATGLLGRRVRVRCRRGSRAADAHGELVGLDFAAGLVLASDDGDGPLEVALETVDELALA